MKMSTDSKMIGTGPTSPTSRLEGGLKKLDFMDFKKLLSLLSLLIFPSLEFEEDSYHELVRVIIAHNFLKFKDESADRLCKEKDALSGDGHIQMIGKILKIQLADTFNRYTQHQKYLDFKGFMAFCRDHDIFPGFISKATLHRVFAQYSNQCQSPRWKNQASLSPTRKNSPCIQSLEESVALNHQSFVTEEVLDLGRFIQCLLLLAVSHRSIQQDEEANANLDEEEEEQRVQNTSNEQ
jgi:hypothetical protein